MFDQSKKIVKNKEAVGSVHAELMLSEQLNNELVVIRNKVYTLTESIENEITLRLHMESQLKQSRNKQITQQNQLKIVTK